MNRQKIHSLLQARLAEAAADEALPIIVRFDASRGLRPLLSPGQTVVSRGDDYRLLPAVACTATPGQIYSLRDDAAIHEIWYDLPVHVCLDFSVPLIQAPRLWGYGLVGRSIRVALLDTGIDETHPDLVGRIDATAVFSGESVADGHGHGTHVAGIIAGSGSFSRGRYAGVAPAATLLAAKVLDARGEGWSSDVMAGIDWAVREGARVINLSLSSEYFGDGSDALSLFCDAAVQQGVVVCVAAGNGGPAAGTIGAPGCARQVITVGASTDADGLAEFSARGPTADGRIKPDLVFPGTLITSTRGRGTSMGAGQGDFYTEASGTSMAAAHCSGAAALLLAAQPELTPAEVKAHLLGGAKDLGRNANLQGAGRGDVYAAYRVYHPARAYEPGAAGEDETDHGDLPPYRSTDEEPYRVHTAGPAAADAVDPESRVVSRGLLWAAVALVGLLACVCVLLTSLAGIDAGLRALETSAALASPTPVLSVLYRQDFDVPDGDWPQVENEQAQQGYVQGRYYLVARQPQSLIAQDIPGQFGDAVLAVDAGQTDGPLGGAYGVIFRKRDPANFYYFGLTSKGEFSFARRVSGQWQEIVPWTPSPAVLQLGYLNKIRVEAAGTSFRFLVNGTTVATAEDATFASGTWSLFVASFDQGDVRADFDALTVWAIARP